MSLKQSQQAFINHIKDPQNHPQVSGIEDRRMKIYRDLFFNNVLGFVSGGFPVLNSLYEDDDWQRLVRQFFIEHDCHSPYFVDISAAFLEYLSEQYTPSDKDYPFMIELAHYEWVELEISIRKQQNDYPRLDPQTLSDAPLVVSEVAWPLSYSFPVHEISEDNIPQQPVEGGVHLIVYRDREDDVQFMLINGVTALLMQILAQNPGVNMTQINQALADALPQFDSQVLQAGGFDMIQKMADRGIICHYE